MTVNDFISIKDYAINVNHCLYFEYEDIGTSNIKVEFNLLGNILVIYVDDAELSRFLSNFDEKFSSYGFESYDYGRINMNHVKYMNKCDSYLDVYFNDLNKTKLKVLC